LHRESQTETGCLNISGNIHSLHAAETFDHNTRTTERVGVAAVPCIGTRETPVSDNGRVISHSY